MGPRDFVQCVRRAVPWLGSYMRVMSRRYRDAEDRTCLPRNQSCSHGVGSLIRV